MGMGKKKKTEKQVRFLLSKGSDLSERQKEKLRSELKSGRVQVTKKKKRSRRG